MYIEDEDILKFLTNDKYIPCGKCKDGYIINSENAYECDCHLNYKKEIYYVINMLKSNVINKKSNKQSLDLVRNYSLSNYYGADENKNLVKIEKFIRNFKKYSYLNMFFSGNPGTQKTTVAKYIVSELVKQNFSCYYIVANNLIEMIGDAQRNEELKAFIKEDLINKDFLVIDELDADKIITFHSGWQKKLLFPFLKERLEVIRKSTLFISNKDISNIGTYFEGAFQDLVEREVPDPLYFKDKYDLYKFKIDKSKLWEDD